MSVLSFALELQLTIIVTVRFQPLPSAPILKNRVFKVSASQKFETVVKFLRKKLDCKETDSVFCYVNSVFAPGLDEGVGGLWRVSSATLTCGLDILTPAYDIVLQDRRPIDRRIFNDASLRLEQRKQTADAMYNDDGMGYVTCRTVTGNNKDYWRDHHSPYISPTAFSKAASSSGVMGYVYFSEGNS